jgi:hypothetical protein
MRQCCRLLCSINRELSLEVVDIDLFVVCSAVDEWECIELRLCMNPRAVINSINADIISHITCALILADSSMEELITDAHWTGPQQS